MYSVVEIEHLVTPFESGYGFAYEGFVAGDIDLDGYTDVVVAFVGPNRSEDITLGDPTPLLLLGDGNGSFTVEEELLPVDNAKGWVNDIVFSDTNGDFYPDFFLVDHGREGLPVDQRPLGNIFLWQSETLSGEVSYAEHIVSVKQFWHGAVNSRDFDQDGYADFTASAIGPIGLWTQSSESSWSNVMGTLHSVDDFSEYHDSASPKYYITNESGYASPAVSGFIDLHGDGDQDLLALPYASVSGSDIFTDKGFVFESSNGVYDQAPRLIDVRPINLPENRGYSDFVVHDFNFDGLEDFLAFAETGTGADGIAWIYLGEQTSSGAFRDATVETFGSHRIDGNFTNEYSDFSLKINIVDVNGDGLKDVFFPVGISNASFVGNEESNFIFGITLQAKLDGTFEKIENKIPTQIHEALELDDFFNFRFEPVQINNDPQIDFFGVKTTRDKSQIKIYSIVSAHESPSESSHILVPNAGIKIDDPAKTIQFSGMLRDYSLVKLEDSLLVSQLNYSDYNTFANGNVRIQFDDINIAFDLDGSAGVTAKILAAVIGEDGLSNKEYVGIGLQLFDAGQSLATVCELALNAVGATTNEDVVTTLYSNLYDDSPSDDQLQEYVELLNQGVFTKGTLAAAAAELTDDLGVIDLVGLAESGIQYV